ncbi:hypothetical protein BDQ17DRAFT_1540456 [Cyathus striatus]|nr:hypothetical protein BDQ17DRAFT_1540456 [Cyathus striatus]
MASPPREPGFPSSPVFSSSPVSIPGTSPSRRRSISPSEISDHTTRLRHSPTLTRSFDPNDPTVRERQRTMDADMAAQLFRARRETVSAGTSPYDATHFNHDVSFPAIPILSHVDGEMISPRGITAEPGGDEDTLVPNRQSSFVNLNLQPHLNQGHDPSLLVAMSQDAHINHPAEDHSASNFGLPTYQANMSQHKFDFDDMEKFAAEEKAKLGINSPLTTRFAIPPVQHGIGESSTSAIPVPQMAAPDSPPLNAQPEDGRETSSTDIHTAMSPSRQRHRKISQSHPTPRQPSHRKGKGGKMALFEASSGDTPASLPARLGLVLTGQSQGQGPSYDNIAGVPSTSGLTGGGILINTGHDRPYRFSFYSNALSATIHARSLSELPAEGQSFEDLFSGIQPSVPIHPTERAKDRPTSALAFNAPPPLEPSSRKPSPQPEGWNQKNGGYPPTGNGAPDQDGNTWWLDVLNPTDEEMKMLGKVFSIHPLTTEDILMEETREKIELFRNYYLVCFRSFDQDPYSPTHLEPLNMYIIVFREGTLSFHFRPTPHPQNVRRRIKQLKDYINVTSDWISYALIDDITDAFGPLIQSIEYEVDSIDELVLILKEAEQSDMLRRIGTCRKKVMGLLRLMGNKADVVKGLAKRCNENWRVAPTSDIGLYLSDIQDHLITMTQNLNHYEKILSRSHSNYLAQISIEMTDANNQINDVLSKLTALGTVLIPMNLVTGLWGMNVHVPGQDQTEGYAWFISIIACLAAFAAFGGYFTYKFMVRK